jgi:hypothetical protein
LEWKTLTHVQASADVKMDEVQFTGLVNGEEAGFVLPRAEALALGQGLVNAAKEVEAERRKGAEETIRRYEEGR